MSVKARLMFEQIYFDAQAIKSRTHHPYICSSDTKEQIVAQTGFFSLVKEHSLVEGKMGFQFAVLRIKIDFLSHHTRGRWVG